MTMDMVITPEFVRALGVLLAACVIDLTLGVSVAIKTQTFNWSKVANFYTTNILPNVLGWGVADVVLRLAAGLTTPDLAQLIQVLAGGGLYALAMAALIGSVTEKLTVLRTQA